MKKFWKKLQFIAFLFMLSLNVNAASIMGGSITWDYLGKDSFLINLNLYRDCNGMTFGGSYILMKCASTGALIDTIFFSSVTPVDVTGACKNSCNQCISSSCSFPYGVELYKYTKVAVIKNAGSCCDIRMEYHGGYRYSAITTGPANTLIYLEAKLNRCLSQPDNSPVFNTELNAFACVAHDIRISFNVNDIDTSNGLRDSISYEMSCPFTNVGTCATYTTANPIYYWGYPNAKLPFPRGFHLDQSTGDMDFRPMRVEASTIVVRAKEWRKINGTYNVIGEIMHEIPFIVISCPTNHAPVLSGPFYKEVCAGDTVSFTITTNDYDTGDTLNMSWDKSIKGAAWRDSNGMVKHPTGFLTLITDSSMVSSIPYVFKVTVKDDACPVNGASTRAYQILVKPLPKANITKVDSGCRNYHFFAKAISAYKPTYFWKGNFSPGFNMHGDSINYKFNSHGKYPYTLELSVNNCSTTYYDTVNVDTLLELQIAKSINACVGDTVKLVANYKYNKGPVKFYWNTGDTTQTINYVCTKNATVWVVVSDTMCQISDAFIIQVGAYPKPDFGTDKLYCPGSLLDLPLSGLSSSDTLYFYNKHTGYLISKDTIPVVSDSGIYVAKVVSEFGCIGTDEVNVFRFNEKNSYLNDLSVCYKNDTVLHADFQKNINSIVYYNWYELPGNNLSYSGNDYKVNVTGSRSMVLNIEEKFNTSSCYDTDTLNISVKLPAVKILKPINFCKSDSFYNLNNFVDSSLGKIQGNHWAILKKQFFNPAKYPGAYIYFDVKLIDYTSACSLDSNIYASVYNLPLISINTPNQRKEFCSQFGLISLTANPSGGKWFGPLDSLNRFNTNCPDGVYPIYYQYVDNKGCQNSDTVYLKVGIPKVSIFSNDTLSCGIHGIYLMASFSVASGIKWYLNSGADGNLHTGLIDTQRVYFPGEKDRENKGTLIYVQTTDTVCVNATDSTFLSYKVLPDIDFTTDVKEGPLPLIVNFSNLTTLQQGKIIQYTWRFGDGDTSNLENPQHTYHKSGSYHVRLIAKSDFGCYDSTDYLNKIKVWTVSTPEQPNPLNIKVFPNPTQSKIEIVAENETGISKVQLFNFLGVKIREFEVGNQKEFEIERGNLPAGVYYMLVIDSNLMNYKFQLLFL